MILGYYEDGPDLVTLAMNGWGGTEPAWWLNLRAQPDVPVTLKNGTRSVRARAAQGEERDAFPGDVELVWRRHRRLRDRLT